MSQLFLEFVGKCSEVTSTDAGNCVCGLVAAGGKAVVEVGGEREGRLGKFMGRGRN